jgi:hypothetical protein
MEHTRVCLASGHRQRLDRGVGNELQSPRQDLPERVGLKLYSVDSVLAEGKCSDSIDILHVIGSGVVGRNVALRDIAHNNVKSDSVA